MEELTKKEKRYLIISILGVAVAIGIIASDWVYITFGRSTQGIMVLVVVAVALMAWAIICIKDTGYRPRRFRGHTLMTPDEVYELAKERKALREANSQADQERKEKEWFCFKEGLCPACGNGDVRQITTHENAGYRCRCCNYRMYW